MKNRKLSIRISGEDLQTLRGQQFKVGGSSNLADFYTTLFWITLIFGIIFIIVDIAIASSKEKDSGYVVRENLFSETMGKENQWICTRCGNINSSLFGECISCNAPKPNSIAAKKGAVSQANMGEWKCSKCGAINRNYIGTCGCGEEKPQ